MYHVDSLSAVGGCNEEASLVLGPEKLESYREFHGATIAGSYFE